MPVYLYWGEDDFAIAQAVESLKTEVLDPNWLDFNYHKLAGDVAENIIEALNQALTPVFGAGERFVYVTNASVTQQCSENLLSQLTQKIPLIPQTSHLVLTTPKKPDRRLKSTKLLEKYSEVKNFDLIPPWETDKLCQQVKLVAEKLNLNLSQAAVVFLVEAIGNDTRKLWNEMTKLSIYQGENNQVLDKENISKLVISSTQNSLQLAKAIKDGDSALALSLATDLLSHNEPALKIVATLTGQFRRWTIIKLMTEAREKDDKIIAKLAEISNPYRIRYLKQEIRHLNSSTLLSMLPILLELEHNLKSGNQALSSLSTAIVLLCELVTQSTKR